MYDINYQSYISNVAGKENPEGERKRTIQRITVNL